MSSPEFSPLDDWSTQALPGLYWSGISPDPARRFTPWFDVVLKPARDVIRIEALGELDLSARPRLQDEVDGLLSSGFDQLVIDLRHLSFIDIAGVRLLHHLTADARHAGWQLSLFHARPLVQRVIAFGDPLGALPFVSS